MRDHHNLRRTIGALRGEVPMRPEWRSAVLRDIEALPDPGARDPLPIAHRRRWVLRPFTAIAAGLMCAVLGGAITLGVERLTSHDRVVRTLAGPTHAIQDGSAVRFVLLAPEASTVSLVGDFNGWNPTTTPMRRTPSGMWSVELPLAAGRHAYAFVVDGVLVPDPDGLDSADDDFGVRSSVVLVSERPRT